ncbi:MAG: hypothetical protein AAGI54_13310 [Planctomycetota bacterium]
MPNPSPIVPPACVGLSLLAAASAAAVEPFNPLVEPDRFQVTTFATGLNYPLGMTTLSDGSVLVATTVKTTPAGQFYSVDGVGQVLRFTDVDNDGVADGPGQVVADNLPGGLTGLERRGDLVFVTSSEPGQEAIHLFTPGATPADSLTPVKTLTFDFPDGTLHSTNALATRDKPGSPGVVEVFFNVASAFDNVDSTEPVGLTDGDGLNASLVADTVYSLAVELDTAGPTPTAAISDVTKIADGLRNASGLAFDPATGDLYLVDNAINNPKSREELNVVAAGDLGTVVPDFGFADDYTLLDGTVVNPGGASIAQPLSTLVTADDDLAISPVDIAFASDPFADILGEGLFLGFHGSFNSTGLDNETNPVGFYDLVSGEFIEFLGSDLPGIGHPDGLLIDGDDLYITDLNNDSLFGGAGNGAIYRVTALPGAVVPSPSAAAMGLIMGGLTLLRRSRRA